MIDALQSLWTTSPHAVAGGFGAFGTFLITLATWLFGKRAAKLKAAAAAPAGAAAAPAAAVPPAPTPLTSVWSAFLRSLPSAVRTAPVTLVLGERRAGKTALLTGARRGRLVGTSSTADTRVGLYFGDNQIVEEIGGDVLEDARAQTRADLDALFAQVAWQTPLVVVVLNPSLPSWQTAASLNELGQIVRARVDALGAARQRPVRVRVCLTHLDEAVGPGFGELVSALPPAGDATQGTDPYLPLRPASTSATDLSASLDGLSPYVTYGLRAPGFADVVRLLGAGGAGRGLLAKLAPFARSLFDAKTGVAPPVLDGIFLAALPAGKPAALSGDPFVVDQTARDDVASVVRGIDRKHAVRALGIAGVCAAVLALIYAGYYLAIVSAGRDVTAFTQAAAQFGPPVTPWPSLAVGQAEATAGESVTSVADAPWPLRSAFPRARQKIVAQTLQQIRDYYLLPVARTTDPETRVYAVALLYAATDDPIGQSIHGNEATWAARLGVPPQVVTDYVALSKTRWTEVPVLPPVADPGSGASLDGWYGYLSRLSAALGAPKLTPETLAPLVSDARNLGAYVRDVATTEKLVGLTSLLRSAGLPVDTWFGQVVSQGDAPQWVNGYRNDLAAVLTLVRQTSLGGVPDAKGKTLAQALDDLRGLVPPPPAPPASSALDGGTDGGGVADAGGAADAGAGTDGGAATDAGAPASPSVPAEYRFVLQGKQFTVSPARWSALVLASRAALYVRAFEDDTTRRSPFFTLAGPCTGAVGAAVVPSRGPTAVIPCLYTAAVFKSEVMPPLGAFDATLDLVALPSADRSVWTASITQAARDYGVAYHTAMSSYFGSYRLASPTAAALGADLTDMVSPTSFLTDFLKVVAQNADLGPQQGPYLGPIGDSVADFAPVVALMGPTPGKYPNLDKYYALLAPMLPLLGPALPAPAPAPGTPLDARLTPVGKLGLAMVTGGDASPYVAVQKWLDQQATPPGLRAPFVTPVTLAYQFGLASLAQTVQAAYTSEIAPTVQPLLARFPFTRTSDVDAASADVQAVFGPKGSFAQSFQKLVAPVCVDGGGGRWTAMSTPFGPVPLPAGALTTARRAGALATALWGDDGKPKALAFMVTPLPLPAVGAKRTVTLSSVRAGKTSVFGFNQTPTPQALPIEWGTVDSASVTLRTSATGGGDDRYQSTDVGPSEWSFYRLLNKGTTAGTVVSWSFPADTPGAPASAVSFGFPSDPWGPFSAPPSGS